MCIAPGSQLCVLEEGITGGLQTGAEKTAGAIFEFFADMLEDAIEYVVRSTMTSWVTFDSIDVVQEKESIGAIRGWVFPIVVAMLVGGLLVQSIRLALERRANPLVQAGRGLATYAVVTTTGTVLVALLVKAGDDMSVWVINESLDGDDFTSRTATLLTMSGGGGATIGVTVFLGTLGLVSALIQGVLMMFRDGALLILLGVLQLAAAGKMTRATEHWLPRIVGWTLAMVCYKPAAAMVYASAFFLAGHGDDARAALTGYALIVLSILALPVLMRLFTWAAGEMTSSGGAGQLMMSAGFALQGLSSMRGATAAGGGAGGPLSAAQYAQYLQQSAVQNVQDAAQHLQPHLDTQQQKYKREPPVQPPTDNGSQPGHRDGPSDPTPGPDGGPGAGQPGRHRPGWPSGHRPPGPTGTQR